VSRCAVGAVADPLLSYVAPLDLSRTRVHTRTVTPDPKSVASAVEHVLGIAAKPFLQRARFALMKRGLLRDPDAAGRLTQISGPHHSVFAPLATVGVLPRGVTYTQITNIIKQDAFRAHAQQLVAAQIAGTPLTVRRIRNSLLDLFITSIYSAELAKDKDEARKASFAADFGDAFEIIWIALQGSCEDVAKRLSDYPVNSGSSFSWAQATLSLATIESLERYISSRSEDDRDWDRWLAWYRSAFIHAHNTIPLPDLGTRREVPYKDLFVEPNFAIEGSEDLLNTEMASDLMDRTVILGDPGAGKSTTSTLLAIRWSENHGPAFFLSLRTMNINPSGFDLIKEIEHNLRRRYQHKCPPGLVERVLLDGSALVVFDGLDEIESISLRKAAVHAIESASARYPLSKILVTSRRIGYAAVRLQKDLFVEMRIRPFSPQQVEQYVRSWFLLASSIDETALTRTVNNFLTTSRTIPDLRRNPLMLSYICVLYRGHNDIPRRRSQLYRKCVELLLFDWDLSRGIGRSGWEVDVYEVALIEIGYLILTSPEYRDGMTERQLHRAAAKNLLDDAIPDRREAERLAREVVERCRGRGWIFTDVGLNEQGEECFSFTHRSFLEYFAAQHLVRTSSSSAELAGLLLPYILSARGEILAQVCINLFSQRTASGGSAVLLELLKKSNSHSSSNSITVLQFLVGIADSIPMNRKALSALLSLLLDSLDGQGALSLVTTCLGKDFWHAKSVDSVLAEVLVAKNSTVGSDLADLVRRYPWLWDFCLEHRVMDLSSLHILLGGDVSRTLGRLFSGELARITERGAISSGLALVDSAFMTDSDTGLSRVEAIRNLSMLRGMIDDPIKLNGLVAEAGPPSPYAMSHLEEACRNIERAISKAAGYRQDILGCVVFLALGLCEVIDEWMSTIELVDSRYIQELLDCRAGRSQLPNGMERLSRQDADFVKLWCQGKATIITWADKYKDFAVS
jgi:hypothetical protein